MIVAALLIGLGFSLLGLVAWVVILPPRERDGFEDFDLHDNFRAAGGAAMDRQGTGRRVNGTSGAQSSPTDRE